MKKFNLILLTFVFLVVCFGSATFLFNAYAKPTETSLNKNLKNAVNEQITEGRVDHIGVYFYDFKTGKEVGVNETTSFYPASLMKVAELMALYKTAEDNPDLLNQKIRYSDVNLTYDRQIIKPAATLQIGAEYAVEDLSERMIIYSDNVASRLLFNVTSRAYFEQTYVNLVLKSGIAQDKIYTLSAKDYALLFKALYNNSYLNDQNSQKVLNLLSKTSYSDGLVAGIPNSVIVAHKFGERSFKGKAVQQLHDCGIIYYPNHPYLLCVMTEGKDASMLPQVIKSISQFVYQSLKSQ